MNLLKIFTYSGILEVFVIPHLLPCIQSLLPSQFVDMVQLGVGFVTELLPRVTINVDSEVLLRVWKDDAEEPADLPGSIKSRNSDPSCSCTSSNGSSSVVGGKGPGSNGNNGSNTCRRCSSTGNQSSFNNGGSLRSKDDDEDCVSHSFTGSIAADREFVKRAASIVVTSKPPMYMQYPSRYVCSVEDGTATSSAPDHLDTFCRSCSVEYQVKPPIPETNTETPRQSSLTPKPYPVSDKTSKKEDADSQFCTSCSLEYVTKLDDKNDSKTSADSSKTTATDSKKSPSSQKFSADLAACKFLDFTNRHNVFSENLEAKAIYFGRNYKDL